MKLKLELGSELDINAAFDGGAVDGSVSYSVPANQQGVITVSATGVVTAGTEPGTAVVEVKDTSGNLLRSITVEVLSAADFAIQSDLDSGAKELAVEFAEVVVQPVGPVLITKNDSSWAYEEVAGLATYSNTTSEGKQYIYRTNSGNMSAGNNMSYLVDGDQATVFSTGGGSQYGADYTFRLFFEKVRRPSKIEIDFAAGCTGDWLIRVNGLSGATPTNSGSGPEIYSNQTTLSEGTLVINLPVFTDFRMLNFSFGGIGGNINIKELRVYEESAPTTKTLISPNSSAANWSLVDGAYTVVESGLTHKAVTYDNHLIQIYAGNAVSPFDADSATYLGFTREYGYFGGGIGAVINVLPTAKKPERIEIDVLEILTFNGQPASLSESFMVELYGVLATDGAANNADNSGTWKPLGFMLNGVQSGTSSFEMSYGYSTYHPSYGVKTFEEGLYKKLKVVFTPVSTNLSGAIGISAIRWY